MFIQRLEKAHTIQMRNIKAMILSESIKYLKENCDKVVRKLTLEHHKLVQQFIAFKARTAKDLEGAQKFFQNEIRVGEEKAIMSPILEVYYNNHPRRVTPLQLYDCLTPKINLHELHKQEMKYGKPKRNADGIPIDEKECQTEYVDEFQALHQLAQTKVDMMKVENKHRQLEVECEQQQYDLKLVDWYIDVFEKGINSQDIMHQYV